MCRSVVRSFRFIATATAGQVITSLIRATLTLSAARETAQRQMAAEERKKSSKVCKPRQLCLTVSACCTRCLQLQALGSWPGMGLSPHSQLKLCSTRLGPGSALCPPTVCHWLQGGTVAQRTAAFRRTMDTCHRRVGELRATIGSLFQGVFMARFRDVCEEVRASVIADIGAFIRLDPSQYLQDNYLKYLAWALSDKVPLQLACCKVPKSWCMPHGCTALIRGNCGGQHSMLFV